MSAKNRRRSRSQRGEGADLPTSNKWSRAGLPHMTFTPIVRTLTVGHPVFKDFPSHFPHRYWTLLFLDAWLIFNPTLHFFLDVTCASPRESKGECGHYNDAADGDRDVGLTNRDGARHDNNLAEWDENKRWASKRGVHETACFFLSMPIGDENEMDTKAPSFV